MQLAENARTRAMWMTERALRHPGTEADVKDLVSLAEAILPVFKENPDRALKLIQTGDSKPDEKLDAAELAAWTIVANTLMNRDDFINK